MPEKAPTPIELLGATSLLGPFLKRRLVAQGFSGHCYSRTQPAAQEKSAAFPWQHLDAEAPGVWQATSNSTVIASLPIWHLAKLLPGLKPCRHLIAFSSTSVFSKETSADPAERTLAAKLAQSEENIRNFCDDHGIAWTLLRPTLIYAPGQDANITAIARFILRWKFFPIAAPAKGLRQPVHADDLAAAAVAAINNPQAFNQAFNLTGGETLPYREMICRVFAAHQKRPRLIPLPLGLLKFGLKGLGLFRKNSYSPELFERMNLDLVFDSTPARQILHYRPRTFHPDFNPPR